MAEIKQNYIENMRRRDRCNDEPRIGGYRERGNGDGPAMREEWWYTHTASNKPNGEGTWVHGVRRFAFDHEREKLLCTGQQVLTDAFKEGRDDRDDDIIHTNHRMNDILRKLMMERTVIQDTRRIVKIILSNVTS